MSITLVSLSSVLLFADCIVCMMIFHSGVMHSARPDTKVQGCALTVALCFIYSAVLFCILLLLKNDAAPFIEKHSEECFAFSGILLLILLIYMGSQSKKSRYTMSQIDKMDGRTFENACADILRDNGFFQVKVTGRAGDGGVDIIAHKNRIKYAIQCKRYKNKLGNSSIQEVFSGKAIYHCDKAVVMTNSYFTKPAVKYAENLSVELWDRDYLKNEFSIV